MERRVYPCTLYMYMIRPLPLPLPGTRSPVSTVSLSSGSSRAASPAVEEVTMHTLGLKIGDRILIDKSSTKSKVQSTCTCTHVTKAVMVGPDKPVIPGQWLFQACWLSSAGNMHNLSGTPPSFIKMYIVYRCIHVRHLQKAS